MELQERITFNSTNEEVLKVIKEESDAAISRSFNILRTRIDKFGTTQPNIQQLGSGRILVELPGVTNLDEAAKTIGETPLLEFKTLSPDYEAIVAKNQKILEARAALESTATVGADGVVNINVKQRVPIIRIYNWNDESYYIDEEAKIMPLSDKYSARVLVANGYINEPFSRRYMYTMDDISEHPFARTHSILDDLYSIAKFIEADDFWKAQVKQLYVNEERDIELIPTAGDHKIIFGDSQEIEGKFNKLMTFYKDCLLYTSPSPRD